MSMKNEDEQHTCQRQIPRNNEYRQSVESYWLFML